MEENRKRNVQINFRVDKKEYDFIVEKAKISGRKNLTQYLRSMAIAGQVINIELDDIKILSANVGRFASSANQIAKRANATGNVYDQGGCPQPGRIGGTCQNCWQAIYAIAINISQALYIDNLNTLLMYIILSLVVF